MTRCVNPSTWYVAMYGHMCGHYLCDRHKAHVCEGLEQEEFTAHRATLEESLLYSQAQGDNDYSRCQFVS